MLPISSILQFSAEPINSNEQFLTLMKKISKSQSSEKKKPKTFIKKLKKGHFSSTQLQVSMLNKHSPPKFLQPIHTYDIYGFFFMYDQGFQAFGGDNSADKIGLFEVTNFYRRINRIERVNPNINIIFCEDTNTPRVPYPLVISRLMSLNDVDAFELANVIENFSSLQVKTLAALNQKSYSDEKGFFNRLNLLKDSKSFVYDIAFSELLGSKDYLEINYESLKESFANEEEFKTYYEYLRKHEEFLKNHKDEAIYEVRYKAKAGSDTYQTMQHYYSTTFGVMICPDDTFYLTSLLRDGFPNAFKVSSNYFKTISNYLSTLFKRFFNMNDSKQNCFIEIDSDNEGKEVVFETMDGHVMPVKMKLSIDIFRGEKFIEVIKRTQCYHTEKNAKFLLSEERKRTFLQSLRNKKLNYEVREINGNKQNIISENDFISAFYPGVIPKNEISQNKNKICHYKEINI